MQIAGMIFQTHSRVS
ncbi:MAG: DUF6783 domain-containing protein [Blautia wexlerae]|nr:DUF6783 domain-containing protein [Blautia wexlerae]